MTMEQRYNEAFGEHPFLERFYEKLTQTTNVECDREFQFLGVERKPLQTKTLRQRQWSLVETVTNYDDLRRHFAETGWADFFDEQIHDS